MPWPAPASRPASPCPASRPANRFPHPLHRYVRGAGLVHFASESCITRMSPICDVSISCVASGGIDCRRSACRRAPCRLPVGGGCHVVVEADVDRARLRLAVRPPGPDRVAAEQQRRREEDRRQERDPRTSTPRRCVLGGIAVASASDPPGYRPRVQGSEQALPIGREPMIPTERPVDAITLLKNDHKAVKKLFPEFQQAHKKDAPGRDKIVAQIVEELSVHAAYEEAILYPAVGRGAGARGRHPREHRGAPRREVDLPRAHQDAPVGRAIRPRR